MATATKPRPMRAKPTVTDADLLDLTPLLTGKHPEGMCPLCGFPRIHVELCDFGGELMYYSCDACLNDVHRADLIRRRQINPAWRDFK